MHILLFFPFYFLFPYYFVPHTKPQNAHLWMVHKNITFFPHLLPGLYSCFTPSSCLIHVVEIADCLQHIPSNFHSRPLLLGSSCSTSQLHVQPGGATTVNSSTRCEWRKCHLQLKAHKLPRPAHHVLFLHKVNKK